MTNLNELVRYLRNAISHFNVEFIGNGQNEISAIRVWNIDPRNRKKTWGAELCLEDIRAIAVRFTQLLLGGAGQGER